MLNVGGRTLTPSPPRRWPAVGVLTPAVLTRVALVTIVAFAFAVRFIGGVTWGLPDRFHPDEGFVIDRASAMVEDRNANPHWFRYPSLYIYVQALTEPLGRPVQPLIDESYDANDEALIKARQLAVGRTVTVLIATLSVVGAFWVARAVSGNLAGIVAAALLAVHAPHVENSQWVTTDVPAAAAVLLVAGCTSMSLKQSSFRWLLAGALAAGLAAGTKYNAGLSLIMPFSALMIMCPWRRWPLYGSVLVVAAALAFIATTPFALLEHRRFIDDLRLEMEHYGTGHAGAEGDAWLWYLKTFLSPLSGSVIAVGVVAAAFRWRKHELPMLAFVLAYAVLIGMQTVRFERNLMPLVPVGAVLAGLSITWVWETLPKSAVMPGRAALAILLVPVIIVSGSAGVHQSRQLMMPDTREVARDWMLAHLPSDSRIIREFYTPGLEDSPFETRNVFALHGVRYDDIVKKNDFVVLSGESFERYFEDPEAYPEQLALYRRLLRLPVVFDLHPSSDMPGPRIVVVSTDAGGSSAQTAAE